LFCVLDVPESVDSKRIEDEIKNLGAPNARLIVKTDSLPPTDSVQDSSPMETNLSDTTVVPSNIELNDERTQSPSHLETDLTIKNVLNTEPLVKKSRRKKCCLGAEEPTISNDQSLAVGQDSGDQELIATQFDKEGVKDVLDPPITKKELEEGDVVDDEERKVKHEEDSLLNAEDDVKPVNNAGCEGLNMNSDTDDALTEELGSESVNDSEQRMKEDQKACRNLRVNLVHFLLVKLCVVHFFYSFYLIP